MASVGEKKETQNNDDMVVADTEASIIKIEGLEIYVAVRYGLANCILIKGM